MKDTKDVLNCLDNYTVKKKTSTVVLSIDVQNMCTCIPNDIGLTSISKYLLTETPKPTPTELLLEMLNLILTKNYFRFEDFHFQQTRGTAMGMAASPTYAFLVVAHWEEEIICNTNVNPFRTRTIRDCKHPPRLNNTSKC